MLPCLLGAPRVVTMLITMLVRRNLVDLAFSSGYEEDVCSPESIPYTIVIGGVLEIKKI